MARRQFGGLPAGSPRTTAIAASGAIALAALAIGIVVGAGPDSSQGASPAGKVAGATNVQRRDLVSTDTESGTLTYANPQTVFNRLSGTITWLPQVGQLIKPGHALYNVNNQPVVLFNGGTPAYRDLNSGDSSGPDVLELNRDLLTMGFDPSHEITVDDSWQAGTTNAVERWQSSVGETQTGTISLGQVVFLPGAQRITSVSTVLGSTGGAGAVGSSGTGAGSGTGTGTGASGSYAPHTEFASLTMTKVVRPRVRAKAAARAAALRASWAEACAAHNLVRLARLKREHPRVLDQMRPSACEVKRTKAEPTRVATQATTATTPAPTATTAVKPSTAAPSTAATPSVIAPTWAAQMTHATTPTRSGSSSGSGSSTGVTGSLGTGGGSSRENATINRALKALLRAETLLLQRSTASSSRGGASGGGSSGGGAGGSARTSAGSGSGAGAAAGGSSSAGASGSGGAGSGSGSSSSAQAILGTTSDQLDVVVDLDATKQSEASAGGPVTVQMPDGSTVNGKITQVSPVAQSSSGSGSGGSGSGSGGSGSSSSGTASATIPVTIALLGRIPSSGLDQAAVSVNFEQQVANNVLSVPVTALLATQGGGYAVQEAAAPHRLVVVTTGLFAAGYVQISGAGVYPGLQVTDSQG